jgi:hypothetical protein
MTLTNELVIERLGNYNQMPPNWVEITESEYYWRFSIKRGAQPEFRQAIAGKHKHYSSVYLWIDPDYSGIGFVVEYDGRATRSEIDAYKPLYFKWTWCEHEFETTHRANCYWEGTCKKCGYHEAIDSSG